MRPLMALFIVLSVCGLFLGFIPADTAFLGVLAPALVTLAGPRARAAPSYSELVDMLAATEAKEVDPLIEALTRRS